MSDPLFDDLARTLAGPMPRRRALKLFGATVLASAVPGLRPRRAWAIDCADFGEVQCGEQFCCPQGTSCCLSKNAGGASCCKPGETCCARDTDPGNADCCTTENPICSSEFGDSFCYPACPGGRPRCNGECCDKDEECVGGKCVPKCPPKRTRCGDKCCPKGYRCRRGKCRKCEEGHKACGKKCCDKGEECYWVDSNPDRKICCDCGKGGKRDCCPVGPPDQDTATCCPRGDRCAKQINQGEGGITSDSPTVCCPKRRYVPLAQGGKACCPPGYRSMGGKLVVTPCPGDPTSDLCCQEELTCGSGKDITCCCPGQSCVEGRCV